MTRIETNCTKMLFDVQTPVAIYLRLRDQFRDTVLLEGADYQSAEDAFSLIGINAIGGVEVTDDDTIELKYPLKKTQKIKISDAQKVTDILWNYMKGYEVTTSEDDFVRRAQGLFGYATYNAVHFFDTIQLKSYNKEPEREIPLMRYRLYQYVLVINHFKSEMYLCENVISRLESNLEKVQALVEGRDIPQYKFRLNGGEIPNVTDADYIEMVKKGIQSCKRGDVFQIVPSRRYAQKFEGDDFNVYRTLRSVNPSPYMFYFDYGNYKLFGSSPESQLLIQDQTAIVHPIAGTYKRTGNLLEDKKLGELLQNDPKEKAEHTMLVDLARNDLSRNCTDVKVNYFKEVHHFSHVLHLVSEVAGSLEKDTNPFKVLANNFPAGTLSGAPKFKAMQLIDEIEGNSRSYYAGTIGFVGFNGNFKHAIMIRSILSKSNTLYYQAGAGVVAKSIPENELQEVNNKLGALKLAIQKAEQV
ncbi:anthranilate synthase component I family protein [Rhizosphaericola mali]|uniref:Anthranilate synthase component 1 n=1 Tax=Rhizosphaericola mali TaxID=2545455 RepID=A0A5P2FWR8_9BACT|nr:anthranilate synthase component I family protein [Rhizosphaericola mali]QES87966.1 anthranilate synthase component I family protein [Rhizosphaericola mali]